MTFIAVYLCKEAEKGARELIKKNEFAGLEFRRDSVKDAGYLSFSIPIPFDIFEEIHDIPAEWVKKVNLKTVVMAHFGEEGKFTHGDAVIQVTTRQKHYAGKTWRWQDISIQGPSIAAVKKIYRLFRKGRLTAAA